ncbi:lipoprotein-anchoring transpeptidase ErfK/SrfK [Streptomonospora salina]|uniref:Lipoprotein-anchoring transpeptidase ErfK/SrfK n=1 Tax=Streptomonospora salina TaxID=104205 RepID=A0A841ECZ9_9ACTN|nr:L,D-transpeptidase [Streptomonospora salina]MBB5998340.1 lipoprotein-anchoring transpeptidase ErfK/SrfK [Streptomonospora salina]
MVTLTACGAAEGSSAAQDATEEPGQAGGPAAEGAEIATVTGDAIDVYTEPGGEEATATLDSPNDFGVDRTFLVERNEGEWLEVLLPVRPNGSTGWVRSDEVSLSSTTLRVEIDLSEFGFSVYDGAEEVRSGEIGTGTPENPTPSGRYYFTELLQPPNPNSSYGPYAYGLSGFSESLESFGGGPGQLAVHGTDDTSTLGSDVSHGCIRVANDDITWMADHLPLGTPVEITG